MVKEKYSIKNVVNNFIGSHKWIVVAYMFLMIAFPLELVVQPHFYGKIIDGVSKSKPSKIIENNKHIIMILIGLWIVNQILYASLDTLDSFVIPKVQSYVRTNLVNDIIYTFKNSYEELEIGSIISKVVKLPHTIRDIQHQIRNFFLPTIIILVVAVTYFYFINKTLGILGFVGLCLFVCVLYFAGQSCISKTTKKDRLHNNLHENIGDVLNNLLPIYSSNTIKQEMDSIHQEELNLNQHYKSGILCSLKLKLTYALMYMIFFLVINGYSFYLFSNGKIKLDYLISILIVVLYLISLLSSAAGEIRDLMFNIGTLNETQKYLNLLLKNLPDSNGVKNKNNKQIVINRGVVEFKNIDFKYPKSSKYVFRNFNLKIVPGESVAIIGQSGEGKSVLLKSIIGLLSPDSGEILIDNQNINEISFKKLQKLRSKFGMVFQFGALFDSMSVGENIGLALQKLTNCDKLEIDSRIKESLREVNMEETHYKMPSELSGGMKKRVGIARAIALAPQYMLYDEPTTGLDPIMTDSINRLINKFHDKGNVTSIIVTHEMKTVKDVSNRVIMLHKGKIQFDGSTVELLNSTDPVVTSFLNGDSTYNE